MRTVIYGGTFNPIHNGHVGLVQYLLSTDKYDRVLLIPAASPPHKDAPQLASGEHRLTMCRLATGKLAGVEVLDWEVAMGGRSYTVDTLHYLGQQYPHDSLYLLIGTDMFLTFTQWRQWQEIGSRARLLVASRERDDLVALEQQQATLRAAGIDSEIMRNPVIEAASTEIRRELAQNGCSCKLDPVVEQYCKEHKLYGQNYDLGQLHGIVQSLLQPSRYHHSCCVEQCAVELATRYGADTHKAAVAGILHDICKNMEDTALLQMVTACGKIALDSCSSATAVPDIDFAAQPQLLHSHAGACYLSAQLGITDMDILNAVRYHTTARRGMSLLEQVIYLADLTSSDRDYPDADRLRQICRSSLGQGMLYALTYIAEQHLPRTGNTPCRDTLEALDEYKKLSLNTGGSK